MGSCNKCLNNNWKFETKRDIHLDGKNYDKYVLAECIICGNEVEFGHKTLSMVDRYGKTRFKQVQNTKI